MSVTVQPTYDEVNSIPGWMARSDFALFNFFLGQQCNSGEVGDLAELGVFLGKSAVVIGGHVKEGEQFTVVDLFDDAATGTDNANADENAQSYPGLAQARFEENYLAVHETLPKVVRGLSSTVLDYACSNSHRFVHIDASHLYEHVRGDLAAARKLLQPRGVVVLDDYRSPHTPGVAAATWEAVAAGLQPIVVTDAKLYGTWSDADRWRQELSRWLPESGMAYETQEVAGGPLIRAWFPENRLAKWVPPAIVDSLVRCRQIGGRGLRATSVVVRRRG